MIKFFRKIRYDLMSENKTSKYFKYAIWNEARKDKIKEQSYLVNLKKDIANDIDFMNRYVIDRYPKKLEVLRKGKNYYQGNLKIKDTALFLNDIGYGNVFGNANFAFSNSTYDQLVNTGDFKVIQNDSLKTAILYYYRLLNATSGASKHKPTGYIKFTNSLAPFNRNNPEYISDFDAKFFVSRLKTEEFYKLINLEITLAHEVKDYAEAIKLRANQLILLIETQLND